MSDIHSDLTELYGEKVDHILDLVLICLGVEDQELSPSNIARAEETLREWSCQVQRDALAFMICKIAQGAGKE